MTYIVDDSGEMGRQFDGIGGLSAGVGHIIVTGYRYIAHLYCLAVQAGFYSEVVTKSACFRCKKGPGLIHVREYPKDPKFSDRLVWANSAGPDQTGQTVQTQFRLLLKEQSVQGLHCLCPQL